VVQTFLGTFSLVVLGGTGLGGFVLYWLYCVVQSIFGSVILVVLDGTEYFR